jgi:hypothetical protein
MKAITSFAAIAALMGGLAVANAQDNKQGGAPGQPKEAGQSEERGPMGRTGGSTTNPSPMAPTSGTGGAPASGPRDVSRGQPNEQGQQQERGPAGTTGGSTQNPAR